MLRAILIGGLFGGALDLLFAVSFVGYKGAAPSLVFQAIASGFLGKAAFSGGIGVDALGIVSHFGLSLLWAGLFAAAAWQFPAITRRPVLAGVGFGIVVFLCMRLVVLPLSAYPGKVTLSVLDLLPCMFLFGTPIAVFVSRAVRACRPEIH